MNDAIQCSICLENITNLENNYLITECKHCFHTNCLLKNISKNGFTCPFCRHQMIEDDDVDDEANDELVNYENTTTNNNNIADDAETLVPIYYEDKWYISSSHHLIYDYYTFLIERKNKIVGHWHGDTIEIYEEFRDIHRI